MYRGCLKTCWHIENHGLLWKMYSSPAGDVWCKGIAKQPSMTHFKLRRMNKFEFYFLLIGGNIWIVKNHLKKLQGQTTDSKCNGFKPRRQSLKQWIFHHLPPAIKATIAAQHKCNFQCGPALQQQDATLHWLYVFGPINCFDLHQKFCKTIELQAKGDRTDRIMESLAASLYTKFAVLSIHHCATKAGLHTNWQ
jgi:hypothetical protein